MLDLLRVATMGGSPHITVRCRLRHAFTADLTAAIGY
jgi:hypothetical protein